MAQADATIANVAAPSISAELGASGAELELVIGGYLVAFAVLLITGARLGQTHGYRRMFLAGIAVFTGASALSGLAPTPAALIAARVLQGAGAALMFPQTLTGIQLAFTGPARVRAIGPLRDRAVSGRSGRAAARRRADLRRPARQRVARHLPRQRAHRPRRAGRGRAAPSRRRRPRVTPHRPARRGRARRSPCCWSCCRSCWVVADGWPAWTWICFAASVPALALFVATQRGRAEPLVNLHALAPRPVAFGLAAVAAATATYYALLFTLALYPQQGLGRSPLVSGLTLVSWVAAFGPGRADRAPRAGARRPLVAPAGCLLLAAAYVATERQPVRGRALRSRSGGAAERGRARARAAVQRPRSAHLTTRWRPSSARHQRRVDHGHADWRRRGPRLGSGRCTWPSPAAARPPRSRSSPPDWPPCRCSRSRPRAWRRVARRTLGCRPWPCNTSTA